MQQDKHWDIVARQDKLRRAIDEIVADIGGE